MEQSNLNPTSSSNPKKNILLWFLVAFAALAVVFFSASYVKKFVEKDKVEKQQADQEKQNKDKQTALSEMLPKVECSFGNDQETYAKAVGSSNINACECITEEKLKETCKE